ncbi:MAG: hypothetical protein DDT40_01222 [candidate division WS2 bacterium]|nr:hypothetical protein [Candidatus Psychracetigena formicireducens]
MDTIHFVPTGVKCICLKDNSPEPRAKLLFINFKAVLTIKIRIKRMAIAAPPELVKREPAIHIIPKGSAIPITAERIAPITNALRVKGLGLVLVSNKFIFLLQHNDCIDGVR